MTRYREVKKYGNAFMIALKPQDMLDLNLKLGDLVDIEDAVKHKSISKSMNKILKGSRK